MGGEGIPDSRYFRGGKEVGDVDDTLFSVVFVKVGGGKDSGEGAGECGGD